MFSTEQKNQQNRNPKKVKFNTGIFFENIKKMYGIQNFYLVEQEAGFFWR